VKLLSVPVAMRDGVRLSANVFLASERVRVPAILVRTPYGKGADITPNYQAFVEHGYAIVVEDVRGRYESEGAFQPLTHLADREMAQLICAFRLFLPDAGLVIRVDSRPLAVEMRKHVFPISNDKNTG